VSVLQVRRAAAEDGAGFRHSHLTVRELLAFYTRLVTSTAGDRSGAGRVAKWIGPIIGWAVLLAVCGGATLVVRYIDGRPKFEDFGQPFTAPSSLPTPTPSWSPKPTDDFDTTVRHRLERWVLATAGEPAPVTSTCQEQQRGQYRCTVTYRGAEAVFKVVISSTIPIPGPRITYYEYDADPVRAIVTRYAVAKVANQVAGLSEGRQIRCDPLPELQVVDVGQHLGQRCYLREDDDEWTVGFLVTGSESSVVIDRYGDR
jgi:hypothetical protein